MSTGTHVQRVQSQQPGPAEDQAKAIAGMPRDMMLLKMENDNIMGLAAAHPRDFELIKKDIAAQLSAFPALAEDAIYTKPVGKDPETGQQKYVRGLSVRAAESLAESYGYNRIRTDVSPIDDDHVKVSATFTDFQKGRVWEDSGIVSKFFKSKYGGMQKIPDDRFYNVVIKAEISRRVREVILRSVNAGLKAWFWDLAEKKIDALLDDSTVTKIVEQFKKIGATQEMLEKLLEKPKSAGWTLDDRKKLAGIWTALKDGETTLAEAFELEPKTPKKDPPSGPVTGDSIGNGTGHAADNPHAKTAAPENQELSAQDEFRRKLRAEFASCTTIEHCLKLKEQYSASGELSPDDMVILGEESQARCDALKAPEPEKEKKTKK